MKRNTSAGIVALGSACLLAGFLAAPAQANAILTVSDGTNTTTVTDNGTGYLSFDSSSWAGSTWRVAWSFATTQPAVGSAYFPDMHLSAGGTGVGTLTFSLFDDGFIGTGTTELLSGVGGYLTNPGGSMTFQTETTQGALASLGPLGPGNFSASEIDTQIINGSYGIEMIGTITNKSWGASSFDAGVQVPEPATWALLGAGLLGMLIVVRRKNKTQDMGFSALAA